MIRISPGGMVLAVLLSMGGVRTAGAAAPDWLKQLQPAALPKYDEEADAVQLLDEVETTFLPDGSRRMLVRRAYRILRRSGQKYGVATAHYDKDGKVLRMKGWSLPREGKPFEVDIKDAIETAQVPGAEEAIISSARMKVLNIPASSPGNLVGYEIESVSRPVIIGENWLPQDQIPVARARYVLRLPAGWSFSASWRNGPAVAPRSGAGTWQWELTDLPAIKNESNMPELAALARTMHLSIQAPDALHSSFADWNAMGHWFSGLLATRSEVTPELTQLVASHTAASGTLFEKTRALSEAVQRDVRYVEVALDATGYQPRAPLDVLKTGYGDCKDKANYLRMLLAQIGVKSQLVLLNTRRGIVQSDSAADAIFNHAVIAIRLPADAPESAKNDLSLIDDGQGGSLLLFDPTDDLTPFGRVGEHLRSGELLLVGADSSRLVHAPIGKPADNGVDRTVTMKLGADGSLTGDVHEQWRGVWASYERGRMSAADFNPDLKRPIEARLAGAVANYQIDSANVAEREAIDRPFEWHYAFTARGYAKVAGDLLMVRPRVVGSKSNSFLETGEARANPVAFSATNLDRDTMRVELPPGYEVDSLPDPVNLDIGFAAYRSRTRLEGRTLVYERSFEQKELDLPVERAAALRDFYTAINRDERAMAVLRKHSAP